MSKNIRNIALISSIEGLITLIWLASIPTGGGSFSPVRLISLSGILLISFGCLIVFIYVKPENRLVEKTSRFINSNIGIFVSFLLTVIAFALWMTILNRDWALSVVSEALYVRLLPIAIFGALICLQTGLVCLSPNIGKDGLINTLRPVWKTTLVILGCFLAVWGFVSITQLGFVYDNVGLSWGPPGTPISFPQINFVVAVSFILALAFILIRSQLSPKAFLIRDVVIFVGLWALAAIVWWQTPVSATHFNPAPTMPTYETYPNSDALIFDKSAYHLLYGVGFKDHLIRRPLYVGMLALFHKLGGSDYESVIFMQILILAFIPPLTYLLTSKLSNRLAGLIAGGLILFREKNAIELSNEIVTSNAKLMMSDMVAMLGIIALVYITVKVLSNKENNIWLLGIAGACLGLTALVRAQVLILIPPLLIFVVISRKPFKHGIRASALIMLGFILVMLPWVLRNWSLTGTFVLDDRGEERLLARNYSFNPVSLPTLLPGETEKEFSARLKQEIIAFIVQHPSDALFFIANHFFRNLATGSVYMAPLISTDLPRDLIDQTHYWETWEGSLNGNSVLSIFITLTLVALGISIAQAKNKSAGWFPLVIFLCYSAGNALVRSSGWRFSLPVDWVVLVYYSIALAHLPSKIVFEESNIDYAGLEFPPLPQRAFAGLITFGVLLLIGSSVPIAERLIPPGNFSDITTVASKKIALENIISTSELKTFLDQENAVFYSGIALYPRYITSDSRIYLAINTPQDIGFLHFWLINDDDNQIIFPIQISPDAFPHTSMVSIIGCKTEEFIMARAVILHSVPEQILVQDTPINLICAAGAPK